MDQLPLEEHPSGSVVGVGSLPGTIRESGVAILPDERAEMGLPVDATPGGQATQRGRTLRDAKGETWQPKDKATGETREARMAREIRCMPCFAQPSVQPKGKQEVKAVDKKGERLKSWGMERKSGAKGEGREEEEGVRYSNHEKVVRYFQKIDRKYLIGSSIVIGLTQMVQIMLCLKLICRSKRRRLGLTLVWGPSLAQGRSRE
jgi:hypothetical protein